MKSQYLTTKSGMNKKANIICYIVILDRGIVQRTDLICQLVYKGFRVCDFFELCHILIPSFFIRQLTLNKFSDNGFNIALLNPVHFHQIA